MNSIESFKECMRQLSTGVTIVTTKTIEGKKEGVTINTFTSLSLNPLLILFNLKKSSFCYQSFIESKNFTVNILSESQQKLSNLFTKEAAEKWDHSALYSKTLTSSPAFQNGIAFLECEHYKHYDGGDHTIMIGKVINSAYINKSKPLMYFRGEYINI